MENLPDVNYFKSNAKPEREFGDNARRELQCGNLVSGHLATAILRFAALNICSGGQSYSYSVTKLQNYSYFL
jgi:hypothetical protein